MVSVLALMTGLPLISPLLRAIRKVGVCMCMQESRNQKGMDKSCVVDSRGEVELRKV